MIDRKRKTITLFELSIGYEKNLESANLRKFLRYHDLAADLKTAGWETDHLLFEVGSRGLQKKRDKKSICDTVKTYNINFFFFNSDIQGMLDGSASKPTLRQDTGYMVKKTYYDIAPYLGAFGAYLMPQ